MTTHELAVVVAPRPVAAAAIDILADWSAAGVVGRVVVVDESAIRDGDFRVPAHVISHDRPQGVSLQAYLADQVGVSLVRVVAVGRVRDQAEIPSRQHSDQVVRLLQATLPSARILQIQAVGATLLGGSLPTDAAWPGWHNMVVAPEDSLAPGAGVERLTSDSHAGLLDAHLLTAVVTLVGAWAHASGSPVDDSPLLPGNQVTLFRTFSRLLSADRVESDLLERLASVENGYPLPRSENEQAWAVEDQVAAVASMGDLLLQKHSYVLPGQRSAMPVSRASKVGALQALRMLFGFLAAALRNAPRAWAESVLRRAAAGAASAAQNVVFGSGDSEFEVVVRGLRPDGTPVSWEELDEVATSLGSRMGVANTQVAGQDFSSLWRDFVGGALTLLDGETRSNEMPAVAVGAHRGVVSDPHVVVPSPSGEFVPAGALASSIKGWSVEPADQISARLLAGELDRVQRENPMLRSVAADERARLQTWSDQWQRTYTGRVGYRLGGALAGTRDEVAQLVKQLEDARRSVDMPDDVEKNQQAVARKLRLLFGGGVAGVVVTGLLLGLGVIGAAIAAALGVIIVLGWLVLSLVAFMQGQQRLFAMLHERTELVSRVELLEKHLRAALDDLRRLIRAYRQYLDWTRALGVFVDAPHGLLTVEARDSIPLGAGLPRCIAFGEVEPQPTVVDEVAARLRNDIFRVGWLTASWDAFLADVPESLGARAFEVRERPDTLWADQGSTERSVLRSWSLAVRGRGPGSGSADQLADRVHASLANHPSNLVERLSSVIRARGASGRLEAVSYDSFVAGLRDVQGRQHTFDQAVFTHLGAVDDSWVVDSTWTGSGTAQVGGAFVVAQRGRGVSISNLSIAATATPPSAHEASDTSHDAPNRSSTDGPVM